ncbi:hypothetical protein [Candidatus Accumulibacter contiguus]|jgi:hypothetical protein|uniref:Uncharacterized protein n=1 Tax=Candidatus Accumulibacter contiguus TaxID=2954381 RepID=A0ABX1T855_9PROT|nr:hypothetical protein [Candidatus Accumulibacter contiguus]NMQ04755.1 hypothetical protein [Candidatus Accumulibacter contiguus]
MKTQVQPVPLTPTVAESETRLIKSAALVTFRFVRATINAAKTVPGIVGQAASDVRDAWEESSRPNA